MTVKKRWVCPDCGDGFGGDYLRCACGYEGSPIYTSGDALFRKGIKNSEIFGGKVNSYRQFAVVGDNHLLAEEFMKKAEIEYQKSKAERVAVECLKKRLQAGLKRINKIRNDDPFEVLGVHKTDSIETIHRTYRAIVALYHPDKHSSATEESRKQKNNYLSKLNGAYEKILQLHNGKHGESKLN